MVMQGFGVLVTIILIWAWFSPEGLGKWFAALRNAYRKELAELEAEQKDD